MKVNKSTKRTSLIAVTAGAVILLAGAAAEARGGWRGGPGRGGGGGRWGGPHMRCARVLMHAHPDLLQEKLGLKSGQLARINRLRSNFQNKKITARAEIQRLRLQMRELFQSSDVPSNRQVLGLMRKIRAQRGRLMEERMKTHLAAMRTLSKEQRTTLRTKCPEMGRRGKWGHRGHHGRGRGPGGGGRGPGGPGHGGW